MGPFPSLLSLSILKSKSSVTQDLASYWRYLLPSTKLVTCKFSVNVCVPKSDENPKLWFSGPGKREQNNGHWGNISWAKKSLGEMRHMGVGAGTWNQNCSNMRKALGWASTSERMFSQPVTVWRQVCKGTKKEQTFLQLCSQLRSLWVLPTWGTNQTPFILLGDGKLSPEE